MTGKAPGRSHRAAVSLLDLFERFPDEDSARRWFEEVRWPGGERHCPRCGSLAVAEASHRHMPYRCTDCRSYFGAKTGTAMEQSKVPLRKWVLAIYLELTSLKGVSSMKLHRDLGVTQKTAWFMLHRIREGLLAGGDDPLTGAVEADETFVGGYRRGGKGGRGKAVVAATRERETGRMRAAVVPDRRKRTLHRFVRENVHPDATLYTDELASYRGALERHGTVNHRVGRYVDGMASVNGVESFWATLKRAYHGTYHLVTAKHLDRYVAQFVAKHNMRDLGTEDQMRALARGMAGRRITYRELVAT